MKVVVSNLTGRSLNTFISAFIYGHVVHLTITRELAITVSYVIAVTGTSY